MKVQSNHSSGELESVFEALELQVMAVSMWLLVEVIGTLLLFSIILGINSLHNDTLLHRMYLRMCLASLIFNVLPLNINLARIVIGPLPGIACELNNFLKVTTHHLHC